MRGTAIGGGLLVWMAALTWVLGPGARQAPAAQAVEVEAPARAAGAGVETFFDVVDVELVELEVWVRAGDEVLAGLTADDFEVVEDDQPVAITHFVAAEQERADALVGVGESPPEPTTGAVGEVGADSFLLSIVIDQYTLPRHASRLYLPAIESLLERSLRPVDRAMLTICDRECRVALEPTSDRAALVTALSSALMPSARGLAADIQRTKILTGIATTPDPLGASGEGSLRGRDDPGFDEGMRDSLAGDIATYVREREDGVRATLASMVRHLATLAGVPGRRLLLYVGEGLQTRFAEPLVRAWQDHFERQGRVTSSAVLPSILDRSLTQAIAETAQVANAVGVTISGLASGSAALGAGVSAEDGAHLGIGQETADAFDQREALSMLAEPTGGTVAYRATDVAVSRLAQDMRPDYVLGYTASTHDTKRRRIEVRVRPETAAGRRIVVRHRSTRQARDAETRMRDRVAAAALYGTVANPLEVALEAGTATRQDDGVDLAVTVRFPLGNVVLLPRAGFHEGRLSLYFAARDAQGRSSPVTRTELPLRIPNDRLATALGQTAAYQTKLTLRAEKHDLVVGVRDEIGGVESTVRTAWSPGGG